jgi:DNA-binding FadR family transcriptional regulator
MASLQRESLPDQVFRELVAAVVGGRYAPGDRLPSQRALAAQLGVNMASVREGIKRLEQLRLVDVRHGDAMRVLDWRAHGGLDVLTHAAATEPEIVAPLFEARRLLLREAARLAAERRTEDHARALGNLATAFAEAADDEAAQAVDLIFMGTVIDAAANLIFTLIINSIREVYLQHLEEFRAIVVGREELTPLYAAAAEAIAAQDGDAAAEVVEQLAAAQEQRMLEAGQR